jgi:large subunit ribosomal protein L22
MATRTIPAAARAIQRTTRQSPYKMRLVIDQIRGKTVNEALALLKFSKKHAATEIEKVLNSAVANAEFKAREANESIDVDELYVMRAVINEGPKLKRFMPAAMGRATPIHKRTSHVEIEVAEREKRQARPARPGAAKTGGKQSAKKAPRTGGEATESTAASKTGARKRTPRATKPKSNG